VLWLRPLLFFGLAALGVAAARAAGDVADDTAARPTPVAAPLARFEVTAKPPAEAAKLLDQVLADADPGRPIDREEEERRLRRLRRQTIEVLATEGYFTPTVTVTADDSGPARYVLQLDLGPRTRVTEVVIEFAGELAQRTDSIEQLRAGWELPVGQPFRDEAWSTAKTRLLNRVRSREFAAARLADSMALVDEADATARLRVQIDSGPA
jgi:translocation and assembly module TamA